MAVFIGLLVAACFGSGDFLGGLGSRRVATISILCLAQLVAVVGAILFALAFHGEPTGRDLAFGAIAGAFSVVALGALYQGLALGRMGIVAPITAVAAACIPVAWGLATGESPSAVSLVGVGLAIGGGRPDRARARHRDRRLGPRLGARARRRRAVRLVVRLLRRVA